MESKSFPVLYRKTANGGIYFWKVIVTKSGNCNNDTNEEVYLITEHGIHDGKMKKSKRKVIKSGRENTLYQKAIKTAEKKWNDKKNKEGYLDKIEETETKTQFFTPMLAKKVIITGNNIKGMKFPLCVQPKLDGFRCTCKFIDGNIELLSRNNLPYKGLPTLKKKLFKLYEKLNEKTSITFDGELYIPDIPFENLSGLIKRAQNHNEYDIKNIEFRVFDCVFFNNINMKFKDRTSFLKSTISNYSNIKYVKTELIHNLDEFKIYFALFTEEGYEGIMVRNPNSPYEISKRSSYLQKYKEFDDDEFEIISFQEGNGVDEKTVIWKCKTLGGEEFSVRPKGNLLHRRNLFTNAKKSIGKMLTVKYQELSELGVPRFPVGKDIRN
jgi:DNA ligase-1